MREAVSRLSRATTRTLQQHNERVRMAKAKLNTARAARNAAVKAALKEGAAAEREIAEAAGISRSMVSQLRNRG